nr:hypothetical protein GCM10010200_021570 [Actinomadura rugatobispora]
MILIEGAAATGKTRLMHILAGREAAAGSTFLSASASSVERNLPLSSVSQLFQHPALTAAESERAERLLGDGTLAAMAHRIGAEPGPDGDADSGAVARVPATIFNGLSAILLEVAGRGPLVIGIDDIHHADEPSLQFLLYLGHRLRTTSVLMLLTECLRPTRPHSPLLTDLLRQPYAQRVRVRPLTGQGVAEMLAEHLGPLPARRLAPECHEVSGGNPLLVQALVEDLRMSGPARPACFVFGEAFRQAVLTCVHRSDSTALARGLAVLPDHPSPGLLGELVRLDAESLGLTREVLRATGLIDGGGRIHEAVRAAVLSGMRPDERTALYLRAAEVLHAHGASAEVVAGSLIAADRARAPWAGAVLREAAGQALAAGGVTEAVGYLRLALRECADDDQRPAIHLELAGAEWQLGPATAARHLPELIRGLREGRLPAHAAAVLVAWLFWLGRIDEALELMHEGAGPADAPTVTYGTTFDVPLWWLRHAYPGLFRQEILDDLPSLPCGPREKALPTPLAPSFGCEARLAGTLVRGAHEETLVEAEEILGAAGQTLRTLAPVVAIAALVYADEPGEAVRWLDSFDGSAARSTPLVNAFASVLRALIHQRHGDLEAAVTCARGALTDLTPKGWGVLVGFPLAILVLALTAMGRFKEVEEHLDVPLPGPLFRSPLVLPYLQARGRYYLATDRPHAALAEFRACGELMTFWECDVPGFVAWRIDQAEAHLALGEREEAGRLAADQLKRLPDGQGRQAGAQLRTRGMTLRVLAAAADADRRTALLTEAVEAQESSGDRLELARALLDLSASYRSEGRSCRATALERRARSLAAECGAELPVSMGPASAADPADVAEGDGADPGSDPLYGLSEAERRVAELAADGYTNRQIARSLHVTMSTVEQHLTRVYRKLKIGRRTDLPLFLMPLSRDSTG